MHRKAFQEAVERVGAPRGEVRPEAVTAHVFCGQVLVSSASLRGLGRHPGERHGEQQTQFVFVGERRHGRGGEFARQHFVEEDKVSEAAPDADVGLLEGGEVGLAEREVSRNTR